MDPDGRSTWVVANGDGTYSVKGGNLEDNDLNIYVVDYDEEGKIRIGESIGKSSSITSFYDSDKHAWKEGRKEVLSTQWMQVGTILYQN